MAKSTKRRGRGEGSVEELGDGRWRGVLSLGRDPQTHRRRKHRVTGRTKAEALARLAEARVAFGRGELANTAGRTVGQWLTEWLQLKKSKIEPATWHWYEQRVRLHLVPVLGPHPLAKLLPLEVEQAYARLSARGVTASEQRRAGRTLRTALKSAVDVGLIPRNPAAVVALPKATAAPRKYLGREQVRAFLAVARQHRWAALWELALDSGCRPGELLALHWPDIDLVRGTIFVRHSLEEIGGRYRLKAPKTARGRRLVRLAPRTVAALADHRRRSGSNEARVFASRAGGWVSQNSVWRALQKLLAAAHCPHLRTYDLRHTSATLLLAEGASVKMVSERLGHEGIEITLRFYAHVLPDAQEQAVGIWARLTDGPPDGPHPDVQGSGETAQPMTGSVAAAGIEPAPS